MDISLFLSLAKEIGYGNQGQESKWAECPESERRKIIKYLLRLRYVRELCKFEQDFSCKKEDYLAKLEELALLWGSEASFDRLPLVLTPFIFFAFNGKEFTLQTLLNETSRFFWHPRGTFMEE